MCELILKIPPKVLSIIWLLSFERVGEVKTSHIREKREILRIICSEKQEGDESQEKINKNPFGAVVLEQIFNSRKKNPKEKKIYTFLRCMCGSLEPSKKRKKPTLRQTHRSEARAAAEASRC